LAKADQRPASAARSPPQRWPPPRKHAPGIFARAHRVASHGDAVFAQCSRPVRGPVATEPHRVGL